MFMFLDDGFKGKRPPPRQTLKTAGKPTKTKSIKITEGKATNSSSPDKINRRPSFIGEQTRDINQKKVEVHLSHQDAEMFSIHPLTAHQIVDPNKVDKN